MQSGISFLIESFKNFSSTGTFIPTFPATAEVMLAPLLQRRGPLKILEVGAGTGAITLPLMEYLRTGDCLTVCEVNSKFVEILKQRLNGLLAGRQLTINYLNMPVQQIPTDIQYDYILCSIPFLRLDVEAVQTILNKLNQVAAQNALFSFVEYMGARKLAKSFGGLDTRKRIADIENYFKQLPGFSYEKKIRVWGNLPPLSVYRLRLGAAGKLKTNVISESIAF